MEPAHWVDDPIFPSQIINKYNHFTLNITFKLLFSCGQKSPKSISVMAQTSQSQSQRQSSMNSNSSSPETTIKNCGRGKTKDKGINAGAAG